MLRGSSLLSNFALALPQWRNVSMMDSESVRGPQGQFFVFVRQDYVAENITPPIQKQLQTALKQQIELMSVYRHFVLLSGKAWLSLRSRTPQACRPSESDAAELIFLACLQKAARCVLFPLSTVFTQNFTFFGRSR